nr:low density lipoprotein receptor-related protein [chickens, Peptide Partial, 8 aa] [Gallus gallus]
DDSGALLR